jgi:FdhD protein
MEKKGFSPGIPSDLHQDSFSYQHVYRVRETTLTEDSDVLAVEEPLEIRLLYGPKEAREEKSITVSMRSPGQDVELAAGFLYTEGIITHPQQLLSVRHCSNISKPEEWQNVIKVELAPDLKIDLDKLHRHFYTTSSCGVCGKSSIEAIRTASSPCLPPASPLFRTTVVHQLPGLLEQAQSLFAHTGGLHAAALFSTGGELILLREDVGRHNAVDKLLGAALFRDLLPLHHSLLLVSSRASFELVQKAVVAGLPIMASIGAPSSLAVQTASAFGLSLLGFVRNNRFNIYTGKERIMF